MSGTASPARRRRSTSSAGAGEGTNVPVTVRSGPIRSLTNRTSGVRAKSSRCCEVTACTSTTRRDPSSERSRCTIRSSAELICPRSVAAGSSTSLIEASVSSLPSASRAEFACTVATDPSWPVFIAWSMSMVSPPRTSPTMIRSGRMRSALRTSSRMVTAPRPSTFAGRDSSRTTWPCWRDSSAASSMVTIRSWSGIMPDSAFRNVVLPEPVPPDTTMFSRARTHAPSRLAVLRSRVPFSTSSPMRNGVGNRRMVSVGPSSANGGMITFTRSPLGSRASTIGDDSSTRRFTCDTMRSIVW